MADNGEFNHRVKNPQGILKLNDQYENHLHTEEFTKGCNAMFLHGTYVLEGEADGKFSLEDIWNLFQGDTLPNNNFCRQMINCIKAWNCLQKISDNPLNTEIIRQTHRIIMDNENVLIGECRKSPVFAGYNTFAPPGYIERCNLQDAIFRFHETKRDDPIMAATNLFGNIINIHPFEDGNGRICRLILAHV